MGKRKNKRLRNITHRDNWLITGALAFAIEGLGATKWPPYSDIDDMKKILAFMLGLEFIETSEGIVLPPNGWQEQALLDLGKLLRDPEPEAKARALACVTTAEKKSIRLTDKLEDAEGK
jgi:hypothetical protein